MPAVDYDYAYYNKASSQDVAKNARSSLASKNVSAGKKTNSNVRTATTKNISANVDSRRKSSTSKVASQANRKKVNGSQTSQRRKQNHESIDAPIFSKKKIEISKPEELKLTKPKVDTKAKKKVEGAKRSIVFTIMAFGMLFVVCTRYTKINEMTHEVNSLNKELRGLVHKNEQLSDEINSKTDLKYIEDYAKYQLGMQKPKESQIVRITYEKQDKISTPIEIIEEEEDSFWDRLLNDLKNLID